MVTSEIVYLQFGLYSCFMGSFVFVLFGSVPAVTVGPTTLMSIMTQKGSSIHPGVCRLSDKSLSFIKFY